MLACSWSQPFPKFCGGVSRNTFFCCKKSWAQQHSTWCGLNILIPHVPKNVREIKYWIIPLSKNSEPYRLKTKAPVEYHGDVSRSWRWKSLDPLWTSLSIDCAILGAWVWNRHLPAPGQCTCEHSSRKKTLVGLIMLSHMLHVCVLYVFMYWCIFGRCLCM